AGPVGEHRGQKGERRVQVDLDGELVDELHTVHAGQLGRAGGALQLAVPVQGDLHRLGVERGAVGEDHVLSDGDGHAQTVRGEVRHVGGQLRHQVEVGVHVVQLLADRVEDHPADEGPGEGGVEDVGLLGQRHPKLAAGADLALAGAVVVAARGVD